MDASLSMWYDIQSDNVPDEDWKDQIEQAEYVAWLEDYSASLGDFDKYDLF